ncbi:NTP transferase domain-containing protein [Qipengyuania sp. MTN3-11]|uniref:nucleotidyltransferase family protein n=1 Tax=Qipengyuania sp. MTN3-11 TaxID=3056557 RepID=UPI0036F4351B
MALILLAAGRSKRFGSDKLTAKVDGRPLWEWAARAAETAGFATRYLVVAAHSSIGTRQGWDIVVNPDTDRGMGSSIAAGVTAAAARERVVIALADMPYVEAPHLRMLGEGRGTIFTRQVDDGAGTPAAFDRESFADLRSLTGDSGARSLGTPGAKLIDPRDRRMLRDIDRPGDLDPEI